MPALFATYVPTTASAATYCTWPDCKEENALFRSSVVVMVLSSYSFVTAQALFDDTCAAIFVAAVFVGTVEFDDCANKATAVGRYVSDVQNVADESALLTPMTRSTLPDDNAEAASVPTSVTSSFRPS